MANQGVWLALINKMALKFPVMCGALGLNP